MNDSCNQKLKKIGLLVIGGMGCVILGMAVQWKVHLFKEAPEPPLVVATPQQNEGPYEVTWVSDGDTFHITRNQEDTLVRLIGVDAPESNHVDPTKNTEEGILASKYLQDLLPIGTQVYLELGEDTYDAYGRLLAYGFLDEAHTDCIEDHLLQDGMADTMPIAPNTKRSEAFEELKLAAQANKLGIWADSNA